MATAQEIRQAQSIVFAIQGGRSIRTDPRSTVGRLVNQALQRQIDLQQSLRSALSKGLLEKKQFAESKARAEALLRAEKSQKLALAFKSTTPTERALKMSLPKDLRRLSVAEVKRRQSILIKPKFTPLPTPKITPLPPIKRKGISRPQFIKDVSKTKSKVLKVIQKFRDITSLGLTKEIREKEKINVRIENFNKEVSSFEKKFIGRDLTEKEFAIAKKKEEELDKKLRDIELKEKSIKKTIPTKSLKKIKSSIKDLLKEKVEEKKRLGIKGLLQSLKLRKIDSNLKTLMVLESGISFGVAVVTLPETTISIISDPSQLEKVPSGLLEEGKEIGKIALISPSSALVKVGAEVFLMKGTGKTFKVVGKLSAKNVARVTGKLRKIEGGAITISKPTKGKGLTIKTISIREIKRKGIKLKVKVTEPKPKKPGLKLEVIKPGLKKILEPGKAQAKLIGKKVSVVTSAQAQKLVGLIRRRRVIRKPIPGEKNLSATTKKLLKKFDRRKINTSEFKILNKRIIKETKGNSNILERSFFVDPKGRVRVSRLGIQKEASLLDIVRGNFTFKTQKPQIIVFENIKVQAFPKTKIFDSIKKKISKQKTLKQEPPKLTKQEASALLKFQTKISGKFKPIGALSKEPELTLAPGEIVRKVKTLAKVEINGVIVPIVKAEIVKGSKSTRKLLSKAKKGKISAKEIKKLRSNLKKETGFKTSLSRRTKVKPRARLPKRIPGRPPTRKRVPTRERPRPRGRPSPRPRGRPSPRPSRRRVPIRGRPSPRPSPGRPSRRRVPIRGRVPVGPPRRPPGRPIKRPGPPIKPISRIRRKRIRVKGRPVRPQGFEVWARPLKRTKKGRRPKLIKVSKVPLSKTRAKDLRNFISDQSLSRTARIKPTKGKPRQPRLKVPTGYSRRTSKKFRRHRVVKGKRVPLPKGKIIERNRYILDTRSEKRGISLKRKIAQLERKAGIRKPIKKRTITIKRRSTRRSGGIFG